MNISCTSTGIPVPTITWTLNNQQTTFKDVETNAIDTATPGNVISTLYIVDAQYPTHDGMYTCTGNNTVNGLILTSNVSITVQVQGMFAEFILLYYTGWTLSIITLMAVIVIFLCLYNTLRV